MKQIPFALPEIGEDEINEVVDTLKSGWLTTGPKTARFEQDFAREIGVPYALSVNSATAGLHLALEAAGVGPGDTVLTSPYTFTASAEVIRYLHAHPVFVDIDPQTWNIDPQSAEAAVRTLAAKNTPPKAILPIHIGGQACDMEQILALAEAYGMKVIDDAAHALPCTSHGKLIGALGDATVFSFYATKPLATGEGGMITTRSEEVAARIKTMRLHGINRDIWDRYLSHKPKWFYEVIEPGFKYNLSDIMASIGIHQLQRIHAFQARRQEIAERYSAAFADLPVSVPSLAHPDDTHAWHLYILQLDLEHLKISREAFIEKLAQKGIGTSVHFIPLHLHPYWRDLYAFRPEDFPRALHCYHRAVSLPIYTKMSDPDVERVIYEVRTILREASCSAHAAS